GTRRVRRSMMAAAVVVAARTTSTNVSGVNRTASPSRWNSEARNGIPALTSIRLAESGLQRVADLFEDQVHVLAGVGQRRNADQRDQGHEESVLQEALAVVLLPERAASSHWCVSF